MSNSQARYTWLEITFEELNYVGYHAINVEWNEYVITTQNMLFCSL